VIEPVQRDENHRKWSEKQPALLGLGAIVTYVEEETPDWWIVYAQPGINAVVTVYPVGGGRQGLGVPLSSGRFMRWPGRARDITIVGDGPAAVTVYVVACSHDFADATIC